MKRPEAEAGLKVRPRSREYAIATGKLEPWEEVIPFLEEQADQDDELKDSRRAEKEPSAGVLRFRLRRRRVLDRLAAEGGSTRPRPIQTRRRSGF